MDDIKTSDICRQMKEMRCSLGEDVEEIVDSARTITDWRYYVQTYPWACLAGSAALGFLVVPKRLSVVAPSTEALEALARRDQSPPVGSGIKAAIFAVLANAAARGALDFIGNNVGKMFGNSTGDLGENNVEPNL